MARVKGIFPMVGTIGGVNFYYLEGKLTAREAGGGFNGHAIKTQANMQRVRENGSEFGHCSRVNKAFRVALINFYMGHKIFNFHSRLMTLFTGLKTLDTLNVRGSRKVAEGVATSEGQTLLRQFNYTPDCDVSRILPFDCQIDPATYPLTITGFDIKKVGFATGATHIELNYGVLDYDFGLTQPRLFMAPALVLNRSFADTTVVLVPSIASPALNTRLCILGVRYYQEANGALYPLNAAEAVGFKVLDVFG